MVKLIHLLAIAAFLSIQAILADAHRDEEYDDSYYNYSEEDWSEEEEPKCPDPNEVYDPCFSPCLQKRCDYDPRLVKCAPAPKLGDPGCVAGCRCVNGYVRSGERCIREKYCKKQCIKPNEVYDPCPGTCPRRVCGFDDRRVRCKRQPKPGDPNCKQPACRCKNGYYRDDKGNCVVWKKCPVCPNLHEVYDPCFSPCLQKNCNRDPRLIKCAPPPKLGDPWCVAGCRCVKGYARNGKRCVPEKQCMGCGGDKNAVPGCGVNCGKKCSDIGKKGPFVCPRICRVNGCDCKKGFYYDNIKKKCVPPGQCTGQVLCEDADVQPVLLRQGNYGFTGKLLYRIMLANPGISAVTSAFSAMGSLGNLALYAKGDTYSEIMKLLNLETNQQIRCSFPPFLDEVKASDGTELRLATKVYVKNEYELSVPFKDDAVNVFRAETESIDFNNANQAADTINQWVSGATNGKITELATPDLFDSLTRLVLANAIYFKGTWLTKFDPAKTTKEDFYVDSQTTKTVDMMHIKNKINYNYLTDLDAQAVQLPYKDENISFIIILPNDKDGISTLVEKLQDGAIFDAAVSTFYSELVDLSLPKMFEETSIDLKQMLKEIGVKTIFDNVNAQLDGMIVPNESLYATDAVLKATITVDENGSEAAAANVIVIGTRSGPRTVIADHPFVYLIKVGKTVVFYGLYCG